MSYSTRDSTVRVNQSVEFDLNASDRAGGLPVNAAGTSLEIRRNEHTVVLAGPATVRQGDRQLSAAKISIALDENYRAQKAVAEGNPVIRGGDRGAKFSLAANQFQAALNQQGWVESIVAEGTWLEHGRRAPARIDFRRPHVEFTMLPERNLIREMNASGWRHGGVKARGGFARSLKTDCAPGRVRRRTGQRSGRSQASPSQAAIPAAGSQRVESIETLAPGTIESRTGNETININAKKFVAQFDSNGRFDKLLGHSGVDLTRQVPGSVPQSSSATELVATLGPDGQWNTLDETGNVRFQQADRHASAATARMSRATGMITLEGSPVLSDSMSRTTAGTVAINQQSGEFHATGGVVSTYLAAALAMTPVNLGSGPAHISADSLSGSSTSGHVIYEGHARLWQGESVLDADRIEIWRDDKKLQATGHVVAVFPQASGFRPLVSACRDEISHPDALPARRSGRSTRPLLTYWSDQGKAHLEGGVTATSDQGSLNRAPWTYFSTPANTSGRRPARPSNAVWHLAAQPSGAGGQQLSRVLAQGDVVVRQGDRRGTAEQAEYTAADQKFVLSGGQPTLTDASSDTTTGRSLTFFVASDTILIDSQEGLRTLTKHRVEK